MYAYMCVYVCELRVTWKRFQNGKTIKFSKFKSIPMPIECNKK